MASSMHAAATAATTTTAATTMHNDHNGNARRSSSPRKEKTILGWLVKSASASASASVSNDNDNDNDNNNRNEQQTNCNCESRAFRDFRGVQTLRLLWSKRISSANEEAAAAAQQQHHSAHSAHSGLGTLRKLNKSVSCLVNAFNNARDWPTTLTNAPETRSKRAASLHNLQEVQQQQHKCKDNFYKYKNAEQAKMAATTTAAAAATTTTNATFAAIKASDGERFLQWPKREEVVMAASKSKADKQRQREQKVAEQVEERGGEGEREGESVDEGEKELQAPLISWQAAATSASPRVSLSATSAHGGSSESLQTLNSISSSSRTTSSTTTTGRATRRKYSFKTHAGKSFHQHHTPRRMSSHASTSSFSSHQHTHNVVGMAAAVEAGEQRAESGVSLVRQLTQQFNEIIQKDARLLEQVKRKNGVWLSRGSHVYKIVEKPSTEGGSSTVQSNIKKFEKLEKPAVPKKPVQLRHNTLSLNKQMRNRRKGLQLGKLQMERQQWEKEQQQWEKEQQQQEKEQQQQQEQVQRAELEVLPELSTDEGVQSDVDDAIKPKPQTLGGTTAAAAASATTLTQSGADEDMEAVAAAEAERQQRRKQKYATIYEKLRFLPFAKAGKRKGLKGEKEKEQTQQEQQEMEREQQQAQQEREQVTEEQPLQQQQVEQEEPPSPCVEADAKILDALEVLNRKLKVLSQPATEQADDNSMELLVSPNDDFEQRLLPNNSFIYQAANKQISNNQLLLNQAVNVTLVNAIEGEQMIMEQKLLELPVQEQQQQHQQVEQAEMEPMYEPITPTMETKTEAQASSLFKITNQMEKEKKKEQQREQEKEQEQEKQKQQDTENGHAKQQSHELQQEDIYQTVEEATVPKPSWLEGYESIAGSCEAAAVLAANHSSSASKAEDDYESFATPPPTIREEPATPPAHITGTLGRNTRDELPELPKPQRKLPKSPIILRPAPAKPATQQEEEQEEEDENIYDTIKGCYESMSVSTVQQQRKPSCDGSSISSNCYESISHYRKRKAGVEAAAIPAVVTATTTTQSTGVQLSSSGSTLTICSDHRTNSLYESSLAAGVLYGSASVGCRSSLASSAGSGSGSGAGGGSRGKAADKRSSIAGSSDNSDAWVDISDGEATSAGAGAAAANGTAGEAQFIVVRERCFKQHRVRSPDWSKRIRDKRLQENKAKSCIEDDSDHYYETLSPLGNKRHSTQLLSGQHHHKRNQDLPRVSTQRRSKQHSASALALGQQHPHHHHHHHHHHHLSHSDDDSDSFEMDSDEHNEEQEQRLQHHNDSGVDMRHLRLPPEPAAPQNQVYAIVRKFKDFISNKKSPKSSQQKLYENTGTQFYVECRKTSPTPELYENATASQLSTSEKNLLASSSQSQQQESNSASLLRPKQKNGNKSLRSRLRKSLVGGAFDTKQLATLAATRSTFYIEDPPATAAQQEQELDSGFSGDKGPVLAVETPSAESQKFSTVARKAKKEAKAMRRRATIGVRPHEPPPPPPPLQLSKSQLDTVGPPTTLSPTTSWYAECGVFKQSSNTNADGELTTPTPSAHGGGSSWYAESGLYQTSGNSVASSSGSSGVSTGNEAGLGDELQPHSLFSNEPLYQVYSAAKLESITRDLERQDSSTDGYEEIGLHSNNKAQPVAAVKSRPTALQLVEPKNGPSRTLWSEIPEVIHSCILPTLTPRERGLQEAKFEIMTSEASYLKSLNLLRRHFMNNAAFCDTSVLSSRDRKALFSYIVPVHECSERLLTELECCWQNNIMLLGLSRCIYEIAEQHFQVYITFCEHQGRMDRTLRRLKESKASLAFQQQLDKLEASPSCCGLNLHSFLMLPMQRITRLPLLIDAVFSKESPHNAEEYESWKMTLALVQKIVSQCNEAANRWEQAYELERISRQLEFPSHIRALAIAPVGVPKQGAKPRFLVKRGELTHLLWRGDDAKLTFGKRFTKISLYAFLFSDLLVLCKRKGESTFTVFDYCPRSMLTLTSYDSLPQLPTKDIKDPTSKNLMLMTLLENFERKTVELVLSCPSVSDQQRWLEAMRPPEAETPGEKLYESWDCPQVIAKHSYESDEPDVLQLEVGDVVNVSRKLPDGWYQGERIRDGALGWFPGSYTEELNSSHVRSRNLKQRHRLLAFTATYLESQKAK